MTNEEPWSALGELPQPRNLADATARLMSVLFWLDASGRQLAALDVNNALEKSLSEGAD